MSVHRKAVERYKVNRERRLSGSYNCIPMKGMTRLSQHIPGVQRIFSMLTANSGIGKTKVLKALWLLKPLEFLYDNPNCGLDMQTMFFCLEENRDKFHDTIVVYKLWVDQGWRVPYKDLVSVREILNEEQLRYLDTPHVIDWFDWFYSKVKVVDNVHHPYGIFLECKRFLEANGTWTERDYHYTDDSGNERMGRAKDQYVPNNPNLYFQCILDNLNAMHGKKGLGEAMEDFCNIFAIDLRDKYHAAVTVAQQQASDQEKKQFTSQGKSIESKLEPSLDGLGDSKKTQRNVDEAYGLFAPDRYEIRDHGGYNISLLEDNYRSLKFLKGRDMEPNYRMPLFFDGAVGDIVELPPKNAMVSDDQYEPWLRRVGRSAQPMQRVLHFGQNR